MTIALDHVREPSHRHLAAVAAPTPTLASTSTPTLSPTPTPTLATPTDHITPLAAVVGAGVQVPLVSGGRAPFVHLDYAASAPILEAVEATVAAVRPWYASVHRGAGFTSKLCTEVLADARVEVARFVGARDRDTVVFTRNTTDSFNLLAGALPPETTVYSFDVEHHANLLPWRRGRFEVLPTADDPAGLVAVLDEALRRRPTPNALLAVTGASNVTGEVLPYEDLAGVAHRHGARVVLDAAQLAPHRELDISAWGVDYVAFSGHKLYAPYGAGVLVGRADWLNAAAPYLAGGGATDVVTLDDETWATGHRRHEGGTPNVLGAVAVAQACRTLRAIGWEAIADHERRLRQRLVDGLARLEVPTLDVFTSAETAIDRVGIAALELDRPELMAAALSAEHGIATRVGAFCAHPLLRRLRVVDASDPVPSALRASLGLGSSSGDIDRFVDALGTLLADGPAWTYGADAGQTVPVPDPRRLPPIWGR